ncbi:MSCRAMM family adhesin SdrC, partial [Lactobacillus delbrueckii]
MEEKFPYTYKREKQRFSIRKTKAWGACSVFLGTSILFLSAGTVARAATAVKTETTSDQNKSNATNTEKLASENQPSGAVKVKTETTSDQNKSNATNTEKS